MTHHFRTHLAFSYATLCLALSGYGCDAEKVDEENTPIKLDADAGADDAGEPLPPPFVPRGAFVLNNAYAGSISVSAIDAKAKVLSEVLISSAAADPKLNVAFSGDTVLAGSDALADELVLIDRSSAVVTWVNPETAKVRAQLDVGPGFDANPQDYLQISEDLAYVSRAAENGDPGVEKFDSGSDLAIIDPSVPKLIGSIDLRPAMDKADSAVLPTPQGLVYAGGRVHVLLAGLALDYSSIAPARIVSIDVKTNEIVQVLKLKSMTNCQSVDVSPSGTKLGIACTGFYAQDPADGWPDSGLVILDVGSKLTELSRFSSDQFQHCEGKVCQNNQVGGVAFFSEEVAIVTAGGVSFGGPNMDIAYPSQVFAVQLAEATTRVIHEADPYELGAPACFAKACVVPDATAGQAGALKFDVKGKDFGPGKLTVVDGKTEMPPRQLQRF